MRDSVYAVDTKESQCLNDDIVHGYKNIYASA